MTSAIRSFATTQGEAGFAVYVGGGQGRTPMVASEIRDFLPMRDLFAYSEAILRIYNLEGRRDNKFKARVKILVHEKGPARSARPSRRNSPRGATSGRTSGERNRPHPRLFRAARSRAARAVIGCAPTKSAGRAFAALFATNVRRHKVPGYSIATISLKPIGGIPGDATAEQMEAVADLAQRYGHDEIRVSHEQNLVLPHVAPDDLPALYDALPRTVSPPPMPGSSPTSSPARASIIARSRPRARSRSRRPSPNASATARGRAISAT